MRRLNFSETKRTPRYSLRKLNVGMASVLLGVTIFGINFTNHSVKAATTENVGNSKQPSTVVLTTAEQTNTQQATNATEKVQQNSSSNDVTEKVQQSSVSNNATANNSTEAATTSQSAPKTQGSADTDIKSSTAKSAAKLAFMNLMAASGTNTDTGTNTGTNTGTGTDRNAAGTVDQNNINTQLAKENQKLANETNLSSSDNYSSNIYKGKDEKYYKIVTIYGNDYVYHAADIQANGTAGGQGPTTAEDTKNNINISKEDLGNGKTRWNVVFFPNKGLQNVGSKLSGLSNAKFGIALTNDYQIVGDVDMDVISDPNQTFMSHTFKPGSNSSTDIPVQNPPAEVKFSFNPNTDVDPNTGLINSETMPAYNNKYLQGPYYFTTATDTGKKNLWQTYFKNWSTFKKAKYNVYDGSPYLGGDHGFYFDNFIIKNETGVDGAKQGDPIIYDTRDRFNYKGVFSSDNFNQAMEFKSQGDTGDSQTQFSSYVISFTTQHTDSHEVGLTTGSGNQQFSGISANIYSWQNGYYNMFSRLYGEQRALNPAGAILTPKDVIPHWDDVKPYMDKFKKDYLNNAQINVLRNKILNNITDPAALNNIVSEGNSLNDAMKNLGNSIGQYDPDGSFADHKVDTTKASDRYKYAGKDEKSAYDTATDAVSNIISVENGTVNKNKGTYADQATVEKLTEAENKAWKELNGVKPKDSETNDPVGGTITVDKGAQLTPTDAQKAITNASKLPTGTTYSWDKDPDTSEPGDHYAVVVVTYPDQTTDNVGVTVHVNGDSDKYKVAPKDTVTVQRGNQVDPGTTVVAQTKDGQPTTFPDGTSYEWQKAPNTNTVGQSTGTVKTTFPDGTSTTTQVTVTVKPKDSETNDPVGGTITVDKGAQLTPTDAQKAITNASKLPTGTTYSWDKDPDTSKPGDHYAVVVVTYPDQTTDNVGVTVHVNGDSDKYKVAPKDTVTVQRGNQVDPGTTVVAQTKDGQPTTFPDGTSYEWQKAPNTNTVGQSTGTVKTTFPDGTSTTTQVTVTVKPKDSETNDPVGGTITVDKGAQLTPTDAQKAITNASKLPTGTTYSWDKDPDTSKPGDHYAVVVVTYPDQTTDNVGVTVHVNGDSDKYKVAPKDTVTVQRGNQVDPGTTVVAQTKDGQPTTFPDGTSYEWQKAPNTNTVGQSTGTVKTTFPDGTSTTTQVTVTVKPKDSETNDPVGGTITVDKGAQLTPTDAQKAITNASKLPTGTTYSWDKDPDTSKPGDHYAVVVVTYPDQTTDNVGVTVHVNGDSDKYKVAPKDTVTVQRGNQVDPGTTVVAQTKDGQPTTFPDGTSYEWQKAPNTNTVGQSTGTVKTTFPDGTSTTTQVTVTVKPKDSETNDPVGGTITVDKGAQLTPTDAQKAITNASKLPTGTTYSWDKDPDTSEPGDHYAVVVVTYPDQTTDNVGVTVHVNGDSDKYKVAPKDTVTVQRGNQVDPGTTVVAQTKDGQPTTFPDGTSYEWQKAPNTNTVGQSTGTVKTTFPDGTSTTTQVTVTVKPKDSETNYPVGGTITVDKGAQLTPTDAQKAITNASKLPTGTTYSWDKDPDTSKPGDHYAVVVVTYPDQTTDNVGVTVHVNGDSDRYKVAPKDTVTVQKGNQVDPGTTVVAQTKDGQPTTFPDGTSYEWQKAPNTNTVGQSTGTVKTTFPDGTSTTTQVTVTVKPKDSETNDPVGGTITVDKGAQLTPTDAQKAITNASKLPTGTTYSWDKDPDTSKPGDHYAVVVVTYPDQTTDNVGVTVHVNGDSDKYKVAPKDTVTVQKGNQVDPGTTVVAQTKDGQPTTFPDGTSYEWQKAPNTNTVGQSTGTVKTTFPDGTSTTTQVTVTVKPKDSETNDPVGGTITVDKGAQLTPTDAQKAITNASKLPTGTTYSWDKDPDTSKPGDHPAVVVVTYPDQTTDNVGVTVHVNGDSDKYKVAPKDTVTVQKGNQVDPGTTVVAQTKDGQPTTFPDGTSYEWQKAPNTNTVGQSTGTVKTTFPDGTSTTTQVTVTVKPKDSETNDPVGGTITVDKGAQLTPTDAQKAITNASKLPTGTTYSWDKDPDTSKPGDHPAVVVVTYPDQTTDNVGVTVHVNGDADKITPNIPQDKVPVANPGHLTEDEKGQVQTNVTDANKGTFPDGSKVTVGDDGTATVKYPDGSKDTIPGSDLVRQSNDADKITPNIPQDKVPVANPGHLTEDEKGQVQTNVTDANKGTFPDGSKVTVGDDGTATVKYPDGSQDTIPGDQLVQGQKGDTTDAGNITPTIPGGKVTVKDPSHLTDSEKDQVKKNVEDANKDKFPAGTGITVGDDGTTTVTYPDGSKDIIAGTDLVIAAESEDVPGSKHHSHRNGSNSSQADGVKGVSTPNGIIANAGNNLGVKGASTPNGIIANAGNNLGVKGESDNAIGNNKATSLKTLPQTGTKDTSILGVLGMLLASLGLFGFKKKRDEE